MLSVGMLSHDPSRPFHVLIAVRVRRLSVRISAANLVHCQRFAIGTFGSFAHFSNIGHLAPCCVHRFALASGLSCRFVPGICGARTLAIPASSGSSPGPGSACHTYRYVTVRYFTFVLQCGTVWYGTVVINWYIINFSTVPYCNVSYANCGSDTVPYGTVPFRYRTVQKL